jgi:putative spermidine/putrescine transport system ATP-binding protein/spermidine/putrescine transport system ATP-binding protein
VRHYQVELGIPFVYVTHNQEEALTMSDRIAVMHNGGFEQVGPKLEVYAKPRTRFVAAFVGSANRLEGALSAVDGDTARLDWNGVPVLVPRPEGARPGDRVECFVKSERIQVQPRAAAAADGGRLNRLAGTLRDIIFKGQYADYFVRLENGGEIVASGPPDAGGLAVRGPVEAAWPADASDAFVVDRR